jgi:hypothetical protein
MDVCMTHRSPSPYRTPETTTLGEGRGFPVTRGFGLVLRLSSRLSSRLSWLRGVFVWAIAGPLSVPRSVFRVPCSVFRVPCSCCSSLGWSGVVVSHGDDKPSSLGQRCIVHISFTVSTRLAGGVDVTPRRLLVMAVQRAWINDNGIMG